MPWWFLLIWFQASRCMAELNRVMQERDYEAPEISYNKFTFMISVITESEQQCKLQSTKPSRLYSVHPGRPFRIETSPFKGHCQMCRARCGGPDSFWSRGTTTSRSRRAIWLRRTNTFWSQGTHASRLKRTNTFWSSRTHVGKVDIGKGAGKAQEVGMLSFQLPKYPIFQLFLCYKHNFAQWIQSILNHFAPQHTSVVPNCY